MNVGFVWDFLDRTTQIPAIAGVDACVTTDYESPALTTELPARTAQRTRGPFVDGYGDEPTLEVRRAMSRGGAEKKRSTDHGSDGAAATSSGRVTAKSSTAPARRTNWLVLTVVILVLIGLVGGFFVALVTGTDPATTTIPATTTQGP